MRRINFLNNGIVFLYILNFDGICIIFIILLGIIDKFDVNNELDATKIVSYIEIKKLKEKEGCGGPFLSSRCGRRRDAPEQ